MKLELLKVLKALVETGTVQAASKRLNKTQPAVSQGLKALEALIGAKLFDRSGYRLELTALGKRIYLQSLRILVEVDDLYDLINHFGKGNEELITIAVDANTDIKRLTSTLRKVQKEFPDTRLILHTEILSGSVDLIKSGKVDIAIAPMYPMMLEEEGFDYKPIFSSLMLNVAAPELIKTMPGTNLISDIRSTHQVVVSDTGSQTGIFDRDFGVQKGQRCWQVSDLYTKKQLLIDGIGWGRLPKHLIEKELKNGELEEVKLKNTHLALNFDIHAFRTPTPIIGPVAAYLWEAFNEIEKENNNIVSK